MTKVVTSYLASIIEALMVGTNFKTAAVAAFFSLPATVHQFHFNGDLRTIIVFHDQKDLHLGAAAPRFMINN